VATCFPVVTLGNPLDPTVVHGGATFENHGNRLTVTNTPGTVINWQAFSIGQNEVTRFVQQSAASQVLNRVTGGDPSQILGALQSNGQVFLINPNGILFGAGARVDVAGLVASTLDISNRDFLSGRMSFAASAVAGGIRNDGSLRALDGGSIYLIASSVENNGVITARDGSVILAAGKTATLMDSNRPYVQVEVTAGGEAINVGRLVGSHVGIYAGTIRAGGTVEATQAVVDEAGRIRFKASGDTTVTADAVVTANGKSGGDIRIESGGITLVEGKVTARGDTGSGGTIQILGRHVGLVRESFIDASGALGGGTVLVGGDYQGRSVTTFNADATFVSAGSVIRADAIERGNGGRIIVWADDTTRVYGGISARGGQHGGDGGFVETSGRNYLDVTRAVDASAPAGRSGTWLLDPNNITVQATGTDTNASPGPNFTSTNDGAIVTVASILTALNSGTNVSITTSSAGTNAQAGDITIAAAINKTNGGAATLSLSAHNDIAINAGIASTSGVLNLVVTPNSDASGGGGVTLANSTALNLNGGALTLAGAGNFTLGSNSSIQSATLARTGTGAYVFGNGAVLGDAALATNIVVNGTTLYTTGNLTLGAGTSVTLTNGGSVYFNGANANLLGTGSMVFGDTSTTNTNALYYNNSTAGTNLTIGPNVTVGGAGSLQNGWIYTSSTNTGIVNQGTISAQTAGKGITVGTSYGSVTNQGLMQAQGGTLQLSSAGGNGTWSNSGTLRNLGGSLNLGGNFNAADVSGNATAGAGTGTPKLLTGPGATSAVNLNGVLNVQGGTFTLDGNTTGNLQVVSNGTLRGGTLASVNGAQLQVANGAELDNVTLNTDLTVGSGTLYVTNNLTLGAGVRLAVDNGNYVYFQSANASVLGSGSVVFGSVANSSINYTNALYYNNSTAGTNLTIGPNVTVGGAGSLQNGWIYTSSTNTGIVNQGTIVAGVAGRTLTLGGGYGSVVNTATMKADAGVLVLNGATLDNTGGSILTANNGRVDLSTTVTTAHLGTMNATGGAIRLVSGGVLDNTGHTFEPGVDVIGSFTVSNGTIMGGVVRDDPANPAALIFESGTTPRLSNVTLDYDVNVASGQTLYVSSGDLTLANGRTLTLGAGGGPAYLYFIENATQQLKTVAGGSAQVRFANTSGESQVYSNLSNTTQQLIIGTGITLGGTGNAYIYAPTLVNQGTIRAGVAGQNIRITGYSFGNLAGGLVEAASGGSIQFTNYSSTPTGFTNAGTIRAAPGGTVELASGPFSTAFLSSLTSTGGTVALGTVVDNTGQTLTIDPATIGNLSLFSGGTIRGGTVTSIGNATLVVPTSGSVTLDTVTLDTDFTASGSVTIFVPGTLTVNGGHRVSLGQAGNSASLVFNGTGANALVRGGRGTAEIAFASGASNNLYHSNGTLDIGAGVLIHSTGGSGTINNTDRTFTNNGVIDADFGGQTITLRATGMTNTGTVGASNGGVLALTGNFTSTTLGAFDSVGGTLRVGAGATFDLQNTVFAMTTATGGIELSGGTIRNGTLRDAGAVMTVGAGNGTLDAVTLDQNLSLAARFLGTTNGFAIQGGRTVNVSGGALQVFGTGTRAITRAGTGTAEILLGSGAIATSGTGTLTLGQGVNVHSGGAGNGSIGSGNVTTLINQGTIAADQSGGSISLSVGSTAGNQIENQGTLAVVQGATLFTNGRPLLNDPGGVIAAGGTINLGAGVTLTNNGIIRPGASPGLTTITGNLVLGTGSVLDIEVAGLVRGTEYDAIDVSGTATLGGTVNVIRFGTYTETAGDLMRVVGAQGGLSGAFSTVTGAVTWTQQNDARNAYLQAITNDPIVVWSLNGSGAWTTAANWVEVSTGAARLPTASDLVIIDQPGSLSVSIATGAQAAKRLFSSESIALSGSASLVLGSDSFITNLTQTGGTLSGAGLVTLTGTGSSFTGGQWTGGGTTRVGSGAILTVSGVGPGTSLANRTLDIAAGGTANFSNEIELEGTSAITNAGTLNLAALGTANAARISNIYNANGTLTLTNTGVINQTGTGSYLIGGDLNNNGTLNINGGTLINAGTGSATSSGVLNLAANTGYQHANGTQTLSSSARVNGTTGNTLAVSGGTLNVNTPTANFNYAGTVQTTGGTVTYAPDLNVAQVLASGGTTTFNGAVTTPLLTQTGGFLSGAGLVTLTGASSFTGGQWTGGGTTRVGSGAVLTVNGVGPGTSLANRTLDIAAGGTANFSNEIELEGTSAITNAGTLNLAALGTANAARISNIYNANGTLTLTNTGTINVIGAGTYLVGADIANNAGGVLNGSATLNLGGRTLTNAGEIRPAGSGAIGAFNLAGNFVQTGTGRVEMETQGNGAGASDTFAISGNATLAGVFELIAINGYQPSGAVAFPNLLTYGSRSGTFDSILGAAFPGLAPTYSQTGLTVAINTGGTPPACPTGFDVCWIGTANGNWSDGAQWSTGTVPTAQNSVYISAPGSITVTAANGGAVNRLVSEESFLLTGGTFTLGGVSSIAQTLTIAGGTLQANANLTAGSIVLSGGALAVGSNAVVSALNSFAWSNGSLSGTGAASVVQIAAPATMNVSGDSRSVSNVTVSNAGQLNLGMSAGSTLLVNDGATIANSGTLTFTESNSIGTNSGAGTLANTGIIAVAVDRTGIIQPSSFSNTGGAMQANATNAVLSVRAATNTYSGTTTIIGDGVRLDGGTHSFTGGSVVDGTLNQAVNTNFGTVALNGTWNQTGGDTTIGSGDTLTLNGTANWSGGGIFGSGGSMLQIAAPATINVTGGSRSVSNLAVNNAGRMNVGMGAANTLFVNDGAIITNAGTLAFTASNTIGTNSGAGSLINTGTLTTGTNINGTVASTVFTNAGLVRTGTDATIALMSGGTHTGAFEAATGGAVVFGGGDHNLADGSRLTNGLLQVTGGSVNLMGTGTGTIIPVGSVVTLNGQGLNGSGKLDNQGTLNLTNSTIAGSVVNSGTVNVAGSSAVNGARFDQNDGVLDLAAGSTLTKNGGVFAWNGGLLGNTGRLAMANGAAFEIAGAGARVLDGPTLDVGQLSLPAGSLELRSGNLTTSGVSTIASGSTLVLNGGAFTNSAPVTVDGTLDLRAGSLTLTGNATHRGGFALAAGTGLTFASDSTQRIMGGVTGAGRVTVAGATLTIDQSYAAATTDVTGGTLTLNGTAQSQTMTVGQGGLLAVNGTTTVGTLDVVGGTVNAAGTLNAATLNHAAGNTNILGSLNVENFSQGGGSVSGTGVFNVTNSYNVTGGTLGGSWSNLSITHRVGDLVLARPHSAQGPLSISVPNGALTVTARVGATGDVVLTAGGAMTISDVEVSSSRSMSVSAAAVRVAASRTETGFFGGTGVHVTTSGDLVLQAGPASFASAFIESGSSSPCSIDVGGTTRLIGGGQNADAFIRGFPDVGSSSAPYYARGPIEFIDGNGGSARIESTFINSIYVHFPGLASGGYTVNGATVTSAGSSGFFAAGTPAVLGQNLHITYGVSAESPPEPGPATILAAVVIPPIDRDWPVAPGPSIQSGGKGGVTTERRPIRQCR